MKKIIYKKVEEIILKSVPEFKKRYLEITKDYGNDLKHIIVGDFSEFFIESFERCNMDIVFRSVKVIELLLESEDDKIKDLIISSFLENIHNSGKNYNNMKKVLMPLSKKYLKSIDTWYDRHVETQR